MTSETDRPGIETAEPIGFEPPIRRMLSARFMTAAAVGWLAGSSGHVLIGGAAHPPGAGTLFWLLLLLIPLLFWKQKQTTAAKFLLGMFVLQAALGIATLLNAVPIPLAAMHQAGAVLLLACALWTARGYRA